MTKYELTLLLEKEELMDDIKKLLESTKSNIVSLEKWGRKNLSYAVKKKINAYYFNLILDLKFDEVPALKKKLDYDEKIMRYLLLKK